MHKTNEANNSDFKQDQNKIVLRLVHHYKNKRTQLRVNFPSSNKEEKSVTSLYKYFQWND